MTNAEREQRSYRAAMRNTSLTMDDLEPWEVECWTRMTAPCPFNVVRVPALSKRNAEEIAAIRTSNRFARYVADSVPCSYRER